MAYTYDPIFAQDPNNPNVVASNATITIYDPADPGKNPITITDPTGSPLPNPITVDGRGMGSAFQHPTLERVAWHGGGLTNYFTSYEGMKNETTAAKEAAQGAANTAAAAAAEVVTTATVNGSGKLILTKASGATQDAGSVVGPAGPKGDKGADGANVLPTDDAIEQAILTNGTKTKTALSATFLDKVTAEDRYTKAITTMTKETNHPRARKPLADPIFTQAQSAAGSIYWGRLVNRAPSGTEGWFLVYSTDHAATHADSGIFRATAASPVGPFTDQGRFYRDDTSGTQTETGNLTWSAADSKWLLYYQQKSANGAVGAQATLLATANAALSSVTRTGIMLDMATKTDPGDGHCGYFSDFALGGRNYGYSLYGGENFGRYALWRSEDGKAWRLDPQQIGPQITMLRQHGTGVTGTPGTSAQTTAAISNNIGWKSFLGYPIEYKGRIWWVGLVGPRSSGAAVSQSKIMAVPLRDDLRGIAEPPIDITPAAQGWEGDGIDGFGNIVEHDGKFYGVYRAGGPQGGFGLLEIF